MGAVGNTDDEGVDNRGHCDTPLGFQRHWQDYPRKDLAEQLTVDSMESVRTYLREPELSRSHNKAMHLSDLQLSHELP